MIPVDQGFFTFNIIILYVAIACLYLASMYNIKHREGLTFLFFIFGLLLFGWGLKNIMNIDLSTFGPFVMFMAVMLYFFIVVIIYMAFYSFQKYRKEWNRKEGTRKYEE